MGAIKITHALKLVNPRTMEPNNTPLEFNDGGISAGDSRQVSSTY